MKYSTCLRALAVATHAGVVTAQPVCDLFGFAEVSTPGAVDLVSGDLNGDGHPDTLVLCGPTGNAQVFAILRNEHGDVVSSTPVFAGSAATSIVAADFDQDGDLDFAVSNTLGGTITLRLNNGAGVFSTSPSISIVAGLSPRGLVAGDFNQDGFPDLAVVSNPARELRVFLSQSGVFGTSTVYPLPGSPNAMVSADFDGDGDADLAVLAGTGGPTPGVLVLRNDGAGGFATTMASLTSGFGQTIMAGDLDNDGDIDLVVGESTPGFRVRVFRNSGTGSVWTNAQVIELASRPRDLALYTTSIPIPGLLIATESDGTLAYAAFGGGTFGSPRTYRGASAIDSVDLNGDSYTDLILANSSTGLGSGTGVLLGSDSIFGIFGNAPRTPAGDGPVSIDAADVVGAAPPGDGIPDVVVVSANDQTVRLFQGTGTSFILRESFTVGGTPSRVRLADMNLDGVEDMVIAVESSGVIGVIYGVAFGNMIGWFPQVNTACGPAPTDFLVADFNGDDLPDLAVVARSSALVTILLNNGANGFTLGWQQDLGTGGDSIAAGDINGDGHIDLVVSTANSIARLVNNGAGQFTVTNINGASTFLRWVGLHDVDQDGDLDLLFTGPGEVSIKYRLNSGSNFGANLFSIGSFRNPQDVIIDDLTGDGFVELVSIPSGFSFGLHVGTGPWSFTEITATNYPFPGVCSAMIAVDVDSDGRKDLIIASSVENAFMTFRNTGKCLPCPADLNTDGILNFFDLAAYLALFSAGDPAADLAAPFGVLNFFDLGEYLARFNAGCP